MRRFLFLSITVLLLAACNLSTDPIPAGPIQSGPMMEMTAAPINAVPEEAVNVAAGEAIYAENCASCHGPQGAGNGDTSEQVRQQGGNIPNLTDVDIVQERSPQQWYQIITQGNLQNLMPPWEQALTDAERWDVAYYLYAFARPDDTLEAGALLYQEHFAEEYGERGESAGFTDPAQMAELTLADIRELYVTGVELTEDERWAVAWYIQSLLFEAVEEEGDEVADEPEAPAGAGLVTGLITNGSGGSGLPDEIQVRGVAIDSETGAVDEFLVQSAPVQPDGTYRLEGLPFDNPDVAYIVDVVYDGVEFQGGKLLEDAEDNALDIPLTIYESTTDPSVLTVETLNIAVRPQAESLQVFQVMVVSNLTDLVYVTEEPVVGGRRGTLAIPVPPDAFGIQFEEGQLGGRFIAEETLIYDTAQITPGGESRSIAVTYNLPFTAARDFALPIPYNTANVNVLVEDSLRMQASELAQAGTDTIGETAYTRYVSGGQVAAGETLLFQVQQGGANILPIALGVILVAFVAAGAVYGLVGFEDEATFTGDLESREAQALLRQLAKLDEAHQAGQVSDYTYAARRADLLATLYERTDIDEGS